MTTKTITIQKQGTITLPKEWLKKMNQAKKITAYFINGNILLSRMENEKEENYLDNFEKIKKIAPTYYLKGKEAEDLDRLVEYGLEEYKKGKCKSIKSLADLD